MAPSAPQSVPSLPAVGRMIHLKMGQPMPVSFRKGNFPCHKLLAVKDSSAWKSTYRN